MNEEEIQDDIEDIEVLTHHEGESVLNVAPGVVVPHNELGHVVHHNLSLLEEFRVALNLSRRNSENCMFILLLTPWLHP